MNPKDHDMNHMKIGVVGAGSWGTALANLLATKGYHIDWWVFEQDLIRQLIETRENGLFLPGVPLSENLRPTHHLEAAVAGKDLALIVVPSHVMRAVTEQMRPYFGDNTILVSASKGIENETQFKRPIAPGLMTVSMADGLSILSGIIHKTGMAFLWMEMDIKAPVFIGDSIYVEIEVLEKRETKKPDRGIVKFLHRVINQGEEIVIEYRVKRMILRK